MLALVALADVVFHHRRMTTRSRPSKVTRIIQIIALVATAFAAPARAVLLDFEDGTDGVSIGNFYAVQGVVFSKVIWSTAGAPVPPEVGVLGVAHETDGFPPGVSDPIVAVFTEDHPLPGGTL